MEKLDFLNQAPRFSIFNKDSNKTKFGGVLFLIEIIALIAVIFIFLYNHFSLDDYSIESVIYFGSSTTIYDSGNEKFDSDVNFTFDILDSTSYSRSDSFLIRYLNYPDGIEGPEVKRKENYVKKPSALRLGIYYRCQNETYCKPDSGYYTQEDTGYNYIFKISYDEYDIVFQEKEPFHKTGDKASSYCPFLFDHPTKTVFHWSNAKYTDEIGMWSRFFFYTLAGNKLESGTLGYIDSYRTYPIEIENPYVNINFKREKLLAIIEIENNIRDYIEYKRIEKSIWVTIANICALISTINLCFSIFNSFYSKNYDNYLIMKDIESKIEKKVNLNNNNINNIINDNNIALKDINKANEEKDENKISLLNIDNNNKEEYQLEDIDDDFDKIVKCNNDNKINFMEFLFNNFYCNCCKRKKKQEIISICNEISQKYLSVENIIYNQIMMEKLLKDYRWNEPADKIIINNELIKLKNIS